jgi:O-antigen/teichoic acid export membrane protein
MKPLVFAKNFRQHFSNISWMLADKIGTLGMSFIIGIFVARYLGPADFGLLGYAQSIAVFFSILAGMGLDSILKRNLVNHADRLGEVMGTALALRLLGAAISMSLFICYALLSGDKQESFYIILIIVMGNVFQSFGIIETYFQSRMQSRLPVIVKLAQFCLANALRIYLIYIHAPVMWFACSLLLSEVANAVGMVLIYRTQPVSFSKWKVRLGYAKEMLRDSWPLIFSGFIVIFYMRIDQIMIKHMLGNEAAGVYSVAVRFSDLWAFLPGVLGNALFPHILSARKVSQEFYHKRLQFLFDIMVWVTLGVILPLTVFVSQWAIPHWYGSEFSEAGDVLMIYIWSGLFAYPAIALNLWLVAENMQKHSLYRTLTGGVVNVILNLVLIPPMGIKGAAIATVISHLFASYLSSLLSRSTWPGFRMQTKALLLHGVFAFIARQVRAMKAARKKAPY